jgi:hypothetical protein
MNRRIFATAVMHFLRWKRVALRSDAFIIDRKALARPVPAG